MWLLLSVALLAARAAAEQCGMATIGFVGTCFTDACAGLELSESESDCVRCFCIVDTAISART